MKEASPSSFNLVGLKYPACILKNFHILLRPILESFQLASIQYHITYMYASRVLQLISTGTEAGGIILPVKFKRTIISYEPDIMD